MDPTWSTEAVLAELGERLRRARLRADVPQRELARRAGLSEATVKNAERGSGVTLQTLVELLRALGRLDDLDGVLADEGPSPIELADRKGRERRRATGGGAPRDDEEWSW